MASFKVDGQATIKHLNIRKQGGGEDEEKQIAVDIKFSMEAVGASALLPLLGVESLDEIDTVFWAPGNDDNARFSGITKIESWAEFSNVDMHIFGRKVRLESCGKFSFVPKGGMTADLTFQVSVLEPDEELIQALAHALSDDVKVKIEAQPELFDKVA